MADAKPGVTAGELVTRLRSHYTAASGARDGLTGGVLLTELSHPLLPRRIDALHIGFTSSRGRLIDGHEVKVSRSDWRAELDQPAKADAWWQYCDRWWIVAPSTDIVPPAELPAGWGLLVPSRRGRRFDVVEKAAQHDAVIDRGLLLEVAKRLDLNRAAADVAQAEAERGREQAERNLERLANQAVDPPPEVLKWDVQAQLRLLARIEAAAQEKGVNLRDDFGRTPDDVINGAELGRAIARAIDVHPLLEALEAAQRAVTRAEEASRMYLHTANRHAEQLADAKKTLGDTLVPPWARA